MSEAEALPPDLDPVSLFAALTTTRFGRAFDPRAICGSTNDEAATRARAGAPEGLVVLADRQTAGRGRLRRTWHSPGGENLYFSLLLRPDRAAATLPPLTLLAGAAVAEAVAALGVVPRLKWPNDVLVELEGAPRKLVGILTEMATERDRVRHVVLGIGINVNQDVFDDEIAARATSLRRVLGAPQSRIGLLADLLNRLEIAYDRALSQGPAADLQTWRRHAGLPRPCRIERHGAVIEGEALDVDEDGALIVRDAGGALQRVLSGELTPL